MRAEAVKPQGNGESRGPDRDRRPVARQLSDINAARERRLFCVRPRKRVDNVGIDQLTPRQREALALIAAGYTNWEIGSQLGISMRTVETHRDHLMRRLDIHTVADLTRYALIEGLITLK
ncbi:MAG: LuxR C-terminal-related transcriptional regulator [Candidatus Latescibacterota bacterium]